MMIGGALIFLKPPRVIVTCRLRKYENRAKTRRKERKGRNEQRREKQEKNENERRKEGKEEWKIRNRGKRVKEKRNEKGFFACAKVNTNKGLKKYSC